MKKEVVALIIVDKNDNILLQDRHAISKYGEEWSFFGGHIEDTETISQTAIREAKEELDLDITDKDIVFMGSTFHFFPERDIEYTRHLCLISMQDLKTTHFNDQEGSGAQIFKLNDISGLKFNTSITQEVEIIKFHTTLKHHNENILLRHGKTDYNVHKWHDSFGAPHLIEEGREKSEDLKNTLGVSLKSNLENMIIVLSPLQRTLQTATPLLKLLYGDTIFTEISNQYEIISNHYKTLRQKKEIIEYIKNPLTQKRFECINNVYVDYRITDIILPEIQQVFWNGDLLKRSGQPIFPTGESLFDVYARVQNYLYEINSQFHNKQILTVSHQDVIFLMEKVFHGYDFDTQRQTYAPENTEFSSHSFI